MANQKPPGNHEDIQIEPSTRPKLIRQTRKDVTHLNSIFETNKKQFKIENMTPFGLLLETTEEITEKYLEGRLTISGTEIGPLNLTVMRSTREETGKFKTACEIQGRSISFDKVHSIEDSFNLIKALEERQTISGQIPDLFARKIYEIKDWLEDIQSRTNEIESTLNKNDVEGYAEYQETFIKVLGDYFNKIMPTTNNYLKQLLGNEKPEVIKICYEFMRNALKDLIYQAPFADRVYNKPLGYAGDYEMMNIIYQDSSLGNSLFAKSLHSYWVKQPAAQAVRNRAVYIQSKIEELVQKRGESDIRILSVASGPSMEWQNILREGKLSTRNIEVTLLDQDESALIHAQRKIREQAMANPTAVVFKYENKAIKNILARGLPEKYDLIYSAGLFDYFSDPVAKMAAQKLYDGLNSKGRLIIGNFDVSNPNSIMMDSALDWRLLYRSAQDMEELFRFLGGQIKVEQENLNINIFCVIDKP
jgi:extracellular factor (EF) 3-hydroxypalmitic acid methyl ester biosynthesis protein